MRLEVLIFNVDKTLSNIKFNTKQKAVFKDPCNDVITSTHASSKTLIAVNKHTKTHRFDDMIAAPNDLDKSFSALKIKQAKRTCFDC